jgi:RimJ/RimL family protein N-acetyltransferase
MIKLIPLADFTELQLKQLANITNQPEVMKWIGTGKLWSIAKLRESIKYLKSKPKDFKAWGILNIDNREIVGYLAITIEGRNSWDIRIFIGSQFQGYGYATKAIKLLIGMMKPKTHLISYIKPENQARAKINQKMGFVYMGRISKYGDVFDKYMLVIR